MPKPIGNRRHFQLCLALFVKSIFPTSDSFCVITSDHIYASTFIPFLFNKCLPLKQKIELFCLDHDNLFCIFYSTEQSQVQMLCYLLECLLTPENTPPDCSKELYELYFVFACVWAFGGAMFQDQVFALNVNKFYLLLWLM